MVTEPSLPPSRFSAGYTVGAPSAAAPSPRPAALPQRGREVCRPNGRYAFPAQRVMIGIVLAVGVVLP